VSTEFYLQGTLSEADLLAKLPPTIVPEYGNERDFIQDQGSLTGKHIHWFGLRGSNGRDGDAYLHVCCVEGMVEHFERFGVNRVLTMLHEIAAATSLPLRDEYGALLGHDDWFSD
jgi:hypothetical protein